MSTLTAVSYLAPNMFWLYGEICAFLERQLGDKFELAQAGFDSLDDPAMQAYKVDLAFICGLPLTRLNRRQPGILQPIAAPVLAAARYENHPSYFADFIVNIDSPYRHLADLRGKWFAYNETGSNSGYHLPRYYLWQAGFENGFFGATNATGAHQTSICWIVDGRADCAAIDSTVLEQALRDDPALAGQIRIIDSTASCPVPPIAVTGRHGDTWAHHLQSALVQPDTRLQQALTQAQMLRLAPVSLEDYAIVCAMFDAVEAAHYQITRMLPDGSLDSSLEVPYVLDS